MASNYNPPPVWGETYERLGMFVGTWRAEGWSYGASRDRANPKADAIRWTSDEATAWHAGRFFVVQNETAHIGGMDLITHAVLGVDPKTGAYVMHAFENHGFLNVYQMKLDGLVWTITGSTERAEIAFSPDGNTQQVSWEWRPEGDTWLPLCERTNVRVATG